METLQTLAITTLMSLFKEVDCWEEVLEKLYTVNPLLWPLEEALQKEWEKERSKKKKGLFKDVHRQLVSCY